ncbi:MAG: glycosyltransferase, partial [bacterium]
MRETRRSVLAVVLTHNAPESLKRCLSSIGAQTRLPEAVLVVDNASEPPVALPPSSLPVTLVRSECNGCPAGGHEIGLRAFLDSDLDLAWVMDDDCIPAATCLDELLAASAR